MTTLEFAEQAIAGTYYDEGLPGNLKQLAIGYKTLLEALTAATKRAEKLEAEVTAIRSLCQRHAHPGCAGSTHWLALDILALIESSH